jgi:crotonobetainyl-CoA:carnitine CoA-transferase CaiB-like acyl-CoA transferase
VSDATWSERTGRTEGEGSAAVERIPPTSLLEGVSILELSDSIAGAYAGRLLRWLGAEVIQWGELRDPFVSQTAEQTLVDWLHAGKRRERELLREQLQTLAMSVDVVLVDEIRTGSQALSWLDEDPLRQPDGSPHIVRLTHTLSGGAARPGCGLTSSAWSGTSWVIGEPGRVPLALPYDLPSYQLGLHGAASTLAVLVGAAGDHGVATSGRCVDVGGRDVLAYYVGMIAMNFLPYERPLARSGVRPAGSAGVYPIGQFRCKDGWVAILIRGQAEWDALVRVMGNPAWAQNSRFRDPRVIARLHADEADRHFLPWVASYTRQELYELGSAAGLAIAPIRELPDALTEPQLESRGFLERVPSPDGPIEMPGEPWHVLTTQPSRPGTHWRVTNRRPAAPSILEGLRVLDLSWVWSGPMVTSVLADLGAEVIKVEHSGHLDTGRLRGRARRNGAEVEGPEHETTPYFNQMSHGKRSVTVDSKTEEGRELLLDLARSCDLVVENMRPGALDRMGLDYGSLAAANPSIVVLSMSMAGQAGPLRNLKGYAGVMSALSGMDALIGYDEVAIMGTAATSLGDPNAGMHALAVTFAALFRRATTGKGAWIDLSQVEACFSVLGAPIAESQLQGHASVAANTHPRWAPYGYFPCAGNDRWLALAIRDDGEWRRLVEVAGQEELVDPAWGRGERRLSERQRLHELISRWTSGTDRDALVERLNAVGLMVAPVASYEDLVGSSWYRDERLAVPVEHPFLGPTDVVTVPWWIDGDRPGIAEPAPLLGAHTDQVLSRLLGLGDAELSALRGKDVLR